MVVAVGVDLGETKGVLVVVTKISVCFASALSFFGVMIVLCNVVVLEGSLSVDLLRFVERFVVESLLDL